MKKIKLQKTHLVALLLIFIIALGGILTGLYMYNRQEKDLQKVKPDFVMTAAELQKAFEVDEAAANSDYTGMVIELSGEVESINPGEDETLIITLKTGNPLSAVSCTFREGSASTVVTAGDQVTVRGQCSGYLMDVLMNNCSLVNNNN